MYICVKLLEFVMYSFSRPDIVQPEAGPYRPLTVILKLQFTLTFGLCCGIGVKLQ
jgi:hypothetical protein